jgi:hypothetical protein
MGSMYARQRKEGGLRRYKICATNLAKVVAARTYISAGIKSGNKCPQGLRITYIRQAYQDPV